MIIFDLICSQGHKFECWFKSSKAFDEQKAFGLIHCPVCEDNRVDKAVSTFGLKKHGEPKPDSRPAPGQEKTELYQALQVITEYVNKNFEDVGLDFTKEALKIHWGESKKRNIKGSTLPGEEKVLKDEGVPFLRLPVLKRLDN